MSRKYQYYMVVTNGNYELPLCTGKLDEVAEYVGVKPATILSNIWRTSGRCRNFKVYKVDLKAADETPSKYPCLACSGDEQSCPNFKRCLRYRTWFKETWSAIRQTLGDEP